MTFFFRLLFSALAISLFIDVKASGEPGFCVGAMTGDAALYRAVLQEAMIRGVVTAHELRSMVEAGTPFRLPPGGPSVKARLAEVLRRLDTSTGEAQALFVLRELGGAAAAASAEQRAVRQTLDALPGDAISVRMPAIMKNLSAGPTPGAFFGVRTDSPGDGLRIPGDTLKWDWLGAEIYMAKALWAPDGETLVFTTNGRVAFGRPATKKHAETEISIGFRDPEKGRGYSKVSVYPNGLAFSDDGNLLAVTTNESGLAYVIDMTTRKVLTVLDPRIPDWRDLVTPGWFSWVEKWRWKRFENTPWMGDLGQVAFSPDGATLYFSVAYKTKGIFDRIEAWDWRNSRRLHAWDNPHGNEALVRSPDGKYLVTGAGAPGTGTVWNLPEGTVRDRLPVGAVTHLAFGAKGSRVLFGGGTGVGIWDTESSFLDHYFHRRGVVTGLTVSPDFDMLLVAYDTRELLRVKLKAP